MQMEMVFLDTLILEPDFSVGLAILLHLEHIFLVKLNVVGTLFRDLPIMLQGSLLDYMGLV